MKTLLARALVHLAAWLLGSGVPTEREPTITHAEAIRLAAAEHLKGYQAGFIQGLWGAVPHTFDPSLPTPRDGRPRWGVLS